MFNLSAIPLRLLAAGILALLLFSMIRSPLRLAPDCGVYVEAASLLVEGKRPYVDFVELNPPLIIYLSAVQVLAARILNVNPAKAFNGTLFLLIVWSVWATRRQLIAASLEPLDLLPDFLTAVWAAFSTFLWLGSPWEINDFGQREHLFVLLWLPYGILRCRPQRSEDSRLAAIALGIAAGIGACIKPYFLFVAVVAELALLLTRRSLRSVIAPETIALTAAAAVYVAHFAFLPADVRSAFFGRWLPFFAKYYSAYHLEYGATLDAKLLATLAIAAAAVLGAQLKSLRCSSLGSLFASLGGFTLGGLAMYFWQDKGFFYQQIPALAGGLLLAAAAFSQLPTLLRLNSRSRRFTPLAFGLLSWAALCWSAPVVATRDDDSRLAQFRQLVETFSDHDEPIAILSSSAWPAYPTLVQVERHQATRFLSFFYISLAMAARQQDGGQSEQLILNELAADLHDRQPPIIFIWSLRGHLEDELRNNHKLDALFDSYTKRRFAGIPGHSTVLIRADRAMRLFVQPNDRAPSPPPAKTGEDASPN